MTRIVFKKLLNKIINIL